MSTFTTNIQLFGADENDFAKLNGELEKRAKSMDQHITMETGHTNGETTYKWQGDVSIEKIADTIFKAAPKTGRKYSFSIMRNK